MAKDIVQEYSDPYMATGPAVLGNLHKNLMDLIDINRPKPTDNNMIVIGASKWFMPYISNPETVGSLIGRDGKLLVHDYTDTMLEGAIKQISDSGFLDKSGLKLDKEIRDEADVKYLKKGTLSFVKANLRDGPLPVSVNSFDIADSTLVNHHAIPYWMKLLEVVSGIENLLQQNNAIWHYGTGHADMDSESSIARLSRRVKDYLGKNPQIIDKRDPEHVLRGVEYNGKIILTKEVFSSPSIILDDKGYASIEGVPTKTFADEGYNIKDGKVGIIHPELDRHHIGQVKGFYSAIFESGRHEKYAPGVLEHWKQGLDMEEGNAIRGLVEHYTSFEKIEKALMIVGFNDIKRYEHPGKTFYNILAKK